VGFGGEILILMALGFVVLGPKQMQNMLGHVAKAKAELDKATKGFKSQLRNELEGTTKDQTQIPE
jgi:Sec-independent protein translocase protein TatA